VLLAHMNQHQLVQGHHLPGQMYQQRQQRHAGLAYGRRRRELGCWGPTRGAPGRGATS
jgi:hypothetical protein